MLGKSFTPEALAAVSGEPLAPLADSLAVLVRREILTVTSDPRSPERGQYEFVQDLLRRSPTTRSPDTTGAPSTWRSRPTWSPTRRSTTTRWSS